MAATLAGAHRLRSAHSVGTGGRAVKYFRLDVWDMGKATTEVYKRQDALAMTPSRFYTRNVGTDASIWTEDEIAEKALRKVLGDLGIVYQESESQQVQTGFEEYGWW